MERGNSLVTFTAFGAKTSRLNKALLNEHD